MCPLCWSVCVCVQRLVSGAEQLHMCLVVWSILCCWRAGIGGWNFGLLVVTFSLGVCVCVCVCLCKKECVCVYVEVGAE